MTQVENVVNKEYQNAPKLYFDCITALASLIDDGVPEQTTVGELIAALRNAEQEQK
jgi:hypothetical protein